MAASNRGIIARFANAVRNRRVELGLTQEALAAKAGINRSYLGDIERGARNVSLQNIEKIAKALSVTPDELLRRAREGTLP